MKDFIVSVRKLTDIDLLHEACETTFIGKSNASLLSLYKSEHSPIRTQLFWITLKNIPLFVSTHLIRHHVGSVPFQLTCREDRKGGSPGMIDICDAINSNLSSISSNILLGKNKEVVEKVDYCHNLIRYLKNNTDRQTPVNLSLLINAQSLIDISKLRLCNQASYETRIVVNQIKKEIDKIDPSLSCMMVPKCIYRNGLCGEPNCCGFNSTDEFKKQLMNYKNQFSNKQVGIN